MNHDELFKSLLKTGRLLSDFFEAFLPKLYSFIDFGHIEFGDKILVFRFAVIDLARLDAREYASKFNAAAMALSTRMRMDPEDRVAFTVDLIRNTVSAPWQQSELDTVLRFFLAHQQFTPKEDLKLQRELAKIEGMEIPKEVLQRNPLVRFGINKGLRKGLGKGFRKGRQQGELDLVLRLLTRRLGRISAAEDKVIRRLPLSGIEALGEALLDFRTSADISRWLKFHTR